MPTVGLRNVDAQQIGAADHLDVEDRNFGAEWYDATGGQTYTLGTAAFTLNLGTTRINTAPTVFEIASNIITLLEAGLYLFNYKTTITHNGGSSNAVSRFWLEEDPDTTVFTLVPATSIYISQPPITAASVSGSGSLYLRAGIDYRYRLRLEEVSGSSPLITAANGTQLSIIRQFKNG